MRCFGGFALLLVSFYLTACRDYYISPLNEYLSPGDLLDIIKSSCRRLRRWGCSKILLKGFEVLFVE